MCFNLLVRETAAHYKVCFDKTNFSQSTRTVHVVRFRMLFFVIVYVYNDMLAWVSKLTLAIPTLSSRIAFHKVSFTKGRLLPSRP